MADDFFANFTVKAMLMQEPGEQKWNDTIVKEPKKQHGILLRQNPEFDIGV